VGWVSLGSCSSVICVVRTLGVRTWSSIYTAPIYIGLTPLLISRAETPSHQYGLQLQGAERIPICLQLGPFVNVAQGCSGHQSSQRQAISATRDGQLVDNLFRFSVCCILIEKKLSKKAVLSQGNHAMLLLISNMN